MVRTVQRAVSVQCVFCKAKSNHPSFWGYWGDTIYFHLGLQQIHSCKVLFSRNGSLLETHCRGKNFHGVNGIECLEPHTQGHQPFTFQVVLEKVLYDPAGWILKFQLSSTRGPKVIPVIEQFSLDSLGAVVVEMYLSFQLAVAVAWLFRNDV